MIGSIVLVALVSAAVVAAVAWPLLRDSEPGDAGPAVQQVALQDDIERSLRAIREIELEHRTGTLSDEDFAELDQVERARAAELLRRRDASKTG